MAFLCSFEKLWHLLLSRFFDWFFASPSTSENCTLLFCTHCFEHWTWYWSTYPSELSAIAFSRCLIGDKYLDVPSFFTDLCQEDSPRSNSCLHPVYASCDRCALLVNCVVKIIRKNLLVFLIVKHILYRVIGFVFLYCLLSVKYVFVFVCLLCKRFYTK